MHDLDLGLLNAIPISLFVLEPNSEGDLLYTYLNDAALAHSKYKLSDFVGKNASQVFHGEFGEFAHKQQMLAFSTAQPLHYELSLPMDGKLRRLETTLNPTIDTNGNVIRIVGASIDISAAYELEQIRSESRNIETELQEFIYLAAHDLRGPMKKIQSIASMMRENFEDLSDENVELVNMLENVSVSSMDMVKNVLRHAEITGLQESIGYLDLPLACATILSTLDSAKQHHCRVDECSIYCDCVIVQAILRNLIENSLKHNEHKKISLSVSAKNSVSGFFEATIEDNGDGMIAPNRLFDSGDHQRSESGFGLLAIRKLIKRRGGHISAGYGADGKGLSVTFVLPGKIGSKDIPASDYSEHMQAAQQ